MFIEYLLRESHWEEPGEGLQHLFGGSACYPPKDPGEEW